MNFTFTITVWFKLRVCITSIRVLYTGFYSRYRKTSCKLSVLQTILCKCSWIWITATTQLDTKK